MINRTYLRVNEPLGIAEVKKSFQIQFLQIRDLYYKTYCGRNCCRSIISKSVCHCHSLPPCSTTFGKGQELPSSSNFVFNQMYVQKSEFVKYFSLIFLFLKNTLHRTHSKSSFILTLIGTIFEATSTTNSIKTRSAKTILL